VISSRKVEEIRTRSHAVLECLAKHGPLELDDVWLKAKPRSTRATTLSDLRRLIREGSVRYVVCANQGRSFSSIYELAR
jgi:hypothetical protein